MNDRDTFALAAMPVALQYVLERDSEHQREDGSVMGKAEVSAIISYEVADAMIVERDKRAKKGHKP